MTRFLTEGPLDAQRLLAEVAHPGCGASTLFLGTVRASAEDGDVQGIAYSSYPEMAEAEFGRLVGEARAQWPGARIALRHRTGHVPLGEASIAIAVAAPHRAEAYECSRFLIEQTKHRVPIWKKEQLGGGAARWVEPKAGSHA